MIPIRGTIVLAWPGALLLAVPAKAATITVTTTADENNADGECALREAVIAANTNVAVDQCTAGSDTETDTIVVPAGTYTLTMPTHFNDNAFGGDLDLLNNFADEDLMIDGAGRLALRLFKFTSSPVVATGNFWGAPTGPGPEPADEACDDTSAGNLTTTPFSPKEIEVETKPP